MSSTKTAYLDKATRPKPSITARHTRDRGEEKCELCGLIAVLHEFEGLRVCVFCVYELTGARFEPTSAYSAPREGRLAFVAGRRNHLRRWLEE